MSRGLSQLWSAHWTTLAAILALLGVGYPVFAQAPADKDKEEKKEIPKPEDITLDTNDGVLLKCTYYGSLLEKHAVPVILIHGWGGSRKDYDQLAMKLQAAGHAVIVPDLRGHGGSIARKIAGAEQTQPVDYKKIKPNEMGVFVTIDLEAVKSYLLQENNSGKLNIEMLCVVGSEFGSIVAVNWAVQDWSWPVLPNMKQGQDVKGIVMISPESQFKGYRMANLPAIPTVASLSMLLVAGTKSSSYAELRRLEKNLERFHYKYEIDKKDDEKVKAEKNKKRDLFVYAPETSLQGKELMLNEAQNKLQTSDAILAFIYWRLTSRADLYEWKSR